MRYFLVSYECQKSFTDSSVGFVTIESDRFPSNVFMKSEIKRQGGSWYNRAQGVVIKNIFEFKNEQDYLDFIAE